MKPKKPKKLYPWASNPLVWVLSFKLIDLLKPLKPGRRERPILFSAPMIRALRAGQKTQTRRPVKLEPRSDWLYLQAMWGRSPPPAPVDFGTPGLFRWVGEDYPDTDDDSVICPFGGPGDRLWAREGIRAAEPPPKIGHHGPRPLIAKYIADGFRAPIENWKWKNKALPAIHMPRSACRLLLELTAVRAERLQSITRADAIAEGVAQFYEWGLDPRGKYRELWDSLNGATPAPRALMANEVAA